MRENKYRLFEVLLNNNTKIQIKAPVSKLTEKYALTLCPHWIDNKGLLDKQIAKEDIINIKGIE